MNKLSLILAAFAGAMIAFPALAQQSSVKDLAVMASAAMDAAREKSDQALAPDNVKTIFAKAAEVAEDGCISFCGFYLGMTADDARALAAHYKLKNEEWDGWTIPSTNVVYKLLFTLRGIRRITKGGNDFDNLSQSVANRIGTMKSKHDNDFNLIGYEFENIDGQTALMSESGGLVLQDANLASKANAEYAAAERRALSTNMVEIPGKNYSICKYEVTQALWVAVMGENPSEFKGPDRPVENVSKKDCERFIEKLNATPEVKASGFTYRLPTADEWEYACLAGATGGRCKLVDGTEITKDTVGEVAWWFKNSKHATHPEGHTRPNARRPYDRLGNVSEWTSTRFDSSTIFTLATYFYVCGNSFDTILCNAHPYIGGREDSCGNTCGFRLAAGK